MSMPANLFHALHNTMNIKRSASLCAALCFSFIALAPAQAQVNEYLPPAAGTTPIEHATYYAHVASNMTAPPRTGFPARNNCSGGSTYLQKAQALVTQYNITDSTVLLLVSGAARNVASCEQRTSSTYSSSLLSAQKLVVRAGKLANEGSCDQAKELLTQAQAPFVDNVDTFNANTIVRQCGTGPKPATVSCNSIYGLTIASETNVLFYRRGTKVENPYRCRNYNGASCLDLGEVITWNLRDGAGTMYCKIVADDPSITSRGPNVSLHAVAAVTLADGRSFSGIIVPSGNYGLAPGPESYLFFDSTSAVSSSTVANMMSASSSTPTAETNTAEDRTETLDTSTSASQYAQKAITEAKAGQCTEARESLGFARQQMTSGPSGGYVAGSSRAVTRAVRVVYNHCGSSESSSAGQTSATGPTTTATVPTTAATTSSTKNSSNADCGNLKNGSGIGSACPAATQVGQIFTSCQRGQLVTVNSCTEAEPCGVEHSDNTQWTENNCAAGYEGAITYRCYRGGKHPVTGNCHLPDPHQPVRTTMTGTQCTSEEMGITLERGNAWTTGGCTTYACEAEGDHAVLVKTVGSCGN